MRRADPMTETRLSSVQHSGPSPSREPSVEKQAFKLLEQVVRCADSQDPRRVLVEGLRCLEGVWGAWLGQPDASQRVVIGTVSDARMQAYVDCIEIRVDDTPEGRGPVGRAWRSGHIQWVDDWRHDPAGSPWFEAVARFGIRSSAAIVLHGRGGAREVLNIYSDREAWFSFDGWPALIEHIASVFGLILEEWDLRRRLEDLARLDPLTQLPNRRALEEYLERALARSQRQGWPFAVGVIDLDDFKLINDRFGHEAGDRLLECIAGRMRASLRREDFIARQGGDEFMVVCDDFGDEEDLEQLLERLHAAIVAPVDLPGGASVQVDASLGLALWPSREPDDDPSPSALLRQADLALYHAKRGKVTRSRWWHIYTHGGTAGLSAEDDPAPSVPPFGEAAAGALHPIQDLLAPVNERFVKALTVELAKQAQLAPLLHALTHDEFERLERRQQGYFTALLDPGLAQAAHSRAARRMGLINAGCSLDETWVMRAHEIFLDSVLAAVPYHPVRLRQALPVISARLACDRRAQLEGYREAARARSGVLGRLTARLGEVRDSLHLTELLMQSLSGLAEIAAVCATRPDQAGIPLITALEGTVEVDASQLQRALSAEAFAALVAATRPEPVEAERGTCAIGHCLNFATAQSMPESLRHELYRLGLRSAAVIAWPDGRVPGHIWLFSRWPGGFSSAEQRTFLQQLGQELALGWAQLPDPGLFTVDQRGRRRGALRDGRLVMHYQPVIELKTGALVKVEALARLLEEGRLLAPAEFLPLLDSEELFLLYRQGLEQALSDARCWAGRGQSISLGLNIPPQGLVEPRYRQATAELLAAIPLPEEAHLFLEVLETERLELANPDELMTHFRSWLALGVHFAEDDLGAGHSSLLRLHRLPFEVVKIDQGLVRLHTSQNDQVAVRKVLAFISALTHLAHALDLRVGVEGLESEALIEAAAALGADYGQGYAIAKPMPAEEVAAWAAGRAGHVLPGYRIAEADLEHAYQGLYDAVRQSGVNSGAHSAAYKRLYDLHAERVALRIDSRPMPEQDS